MQECLLGLEIFPYMLICSACVVKNPVHILRLKWESFQSCVSLYRLGREVTGRVMITNISDRFIKNYQSVVLIGELVRVKVIG